LAGSWVFSWNLLVAVEIANALKSVECRQK
jgi:hypothetical protein